MYSVTGAIVSVAAGARGGVLHHWHWQCAHACWRAGGTARCTPPLALALRTPGVTMRQAGACATYLTTGAGAEITADAGALYPATDAGVAYFARAGATYDTAGTGTMY